MCNKNICCVCCKPQCSGVRIVQGSPGPQGPAGAPGTQGDPPTVEIGEVVSGGNAQVTANPTDTGVSLDFVFPSGPKGDKGEKGEIGEQGPQGEQGETGSQGEAGEIPQMTVVENTKTSYKIRFKTSQQEFTSPNLKSNTECYNYNLSVVGSTANIPLENLTLVLKNTSSISMRISVKPKTEGTSILADIRRASIYDGTIDAQTNNNVLISSSLVLDDIVYTMSQEMHWIRLRQQDPKTKLWSMCEIKTFASQNGSRVTVCIEWLYTGTSFLMP